MPQRTRTALAALVAATAMAVAPLRPAAAHDRPFRVRVEGRELAEAGAFLSNGQLLAWTRPLAEAMGAAVEWDGAEQRITLRQGGRKVTAWVGADTVLRDGRRYAAAAPPVLREGRSYLPVWQLAALFGYRVAWDGQTMTLTRPAAGRAEGRTAGGQGTDRAGGSAAERPGGGPGKAAGLWSGRLVFPFPAGARYEPLAPNFGAPRSWSPAGAVERQHEGQDVMAPAGTPVVAAGAGTVVRIGWNQYGGWRITMALDEAPGYLLYYAHLNGYGPNLYAGARVRAGQVVGYVGSTGYGPRGTSGKFPPHLHVGLYRDGVAVDPFPFLRAWEHNKVDLG